MRFNHITVKYENHRKVFEDFSLDLAEGQITCVMGASGIGKTTLLRMAAGLEQPMSGSVQRKEEERTSFVFQEPRLLPAKTVLENVQWVLERQGDEETNRKVLALLEEAGLIHAINDYPDQPSGGMKQRVSVVRAFVPNPQFLIMDEPFQSLDAATRREMQKLLLLLWHKQKSTVLLVTHDPEEALALGSRIVVLGGSPATIILDISGTDNEDGMTFSETDRVRLKQLTHVQVLYNDEE
ncbi:ABC transporter ATP-binding protein [Aneurinibacillus migulanus]|uniref:ABC transporter ATP-binding protein n=1 Tax=Aneurinibacillus migulanus TaxID=47500 RepID=UPI0020A132B8|nr:ATP-binding cassette domain-containing protein [Aneurinibacillus migulanus]MCP1359310.1 ATP-binding cassette domain-containing protein [Aneurinibacillus migulanus]